MSEVITTGLVVDGPRAGQSMTIRHPEHDAKWLDLDGIDGRTGWPRKVVYDLYTVRVPDALYLAQSYQVVVINGAWEAPPGLSEVKVWASQGEPTVKTYARELWNLRVGRR